ncbi:MAG: amino acid ABC transporter permease [Desulfomicrobium escambiense]|nr:amino acid ABC transporter permease [Desulfomicrobium escambiense]
MHRGPGRGAPGVRKPPGHGRWPMPTSPLFRGIPLVVQLFIWYFGLPHIGIYLTPLLASVLGFSLCSGAYHSEYVRGALLSIKQGQMLAAQALGFTKLQMILSIILPQAIRRALPGCGNEIIYLIKYSSLAYMITCIELDRPREDPRLRTPSSTRRSF